MAKRKEKNKLLVYGRNDEREIGRGWGKWCKLQVLTSLQ